MRQKIHVNGRNYLEIFIQISRILIKILTYRIFQFKNFVVNGKPTKKLKIIA